MVDSYSILSSHIAPLSKASSDNKMMEKLPPPSALFDSHKKLDFAESPDTGRSHDSGDKSFILPPPSSLAGFHQHLPPASNANYHYQPQYYYPSPAATIAPTTLVHQPKKAVGLKRRDEDCTTTKVKKRAKKIIGTEAIKISTSNDDVSAAAAALASFATSPTVNEFNKKDIVPEYPYQYDDDQQSALPPAAAYKKKRTYVTKKQQQQQQQLESNQVLEAARILMDISRCVVRPVSVAH